MAEVKIEGRRLKAAVSEATSRKGRFSPGRWVSRVSGRSFASRHRGGFTLIECLAAGTVLALFGASIVVAAGQSAAATRRGTDRRTAAQHLDEVLTKIDVLGPARVATEGPFAGEFPPGPDGRTWSWSSTITSEGVLPDLYAVEARVTWTDSTGRPRARSTRTRLFDPVGSRSALVRWEDL